jgi:hypothetical protein
LICDDVRRALSEGDLCEETASGARVVTQCLYPSFEPVEVFVAKLGDGYIVTDAGGASASAWLHGRGDIDKLLAKEGARFGVGARDGVIEAHVPNLEWLKSAVLGVANASASAAASALERQSAAAEKVLSEKIYEALSHVVSKSTIARDFLHRGASGKRWHYDFAATSQKGLLLLNAVTPHHVSISAKYVAFADLPANDAVVEKIAVYGRKLETEDATLITQVATLMPVASLERGLRKALARS